MKRFGLVLFAFLLLTSTITAVAPPTMAEAQTTTNSTYALEGSQFINSTGTYFKDSRYWIFNANNSTYAEKPFPYLTDTQPDYPIKWDSATETFIHDDSPPQPTVQPFIPNATPNTPPPVQYVAPNYQPQQVGEPARYPVNVDTENYSIRESVRSDGAILGIHTVFGTPHIIIDGVAKQYHVEHFKMLLNWQKMIPMLKQLYQNKTN